MEKTVFVGVSGGVDSSVALLRLKNQGYNVVAVFIRTWQPDFIECTWKKERLDAMRVAAELNVPFLTFDAERAYKERVADYMIREYCEGRTPNPDVMCNEHVKFGVFYDYALARGADYVATGHYAHIVKRGDTYELHRGADENKDQSYFLWRIKRIQLSHILFPIGRSRKPSIRFEASRAKLATDQKKDSQGVCFLGDIDVRQFLGEFITLTDGDVLDETENIIGSHHGALIYTIGQRHGFTIFPESTTTLPYYVLSRDIAKNTITVTHAHPECVDATITLTDVNILVDTLPQECEAQFRYRQAPFRVQVHTDAAGRGMLTVLAEHADVPAIGQSCVLYAGSQCLGGGIISSIS